MTRLRTPSQTVGPFYAIGLCRRQDNELDPGGIELRGQLFDGRGQPVDDGLIEIWDAAGERWGRSGTDGEGRFTFRVPRDVTHLEAYVFARGLLRHQRTRIYLRDEDDAVLRRLAPDECASLIARHEGARLRFDIRLQGDDATVFFEH